ncbi:AI-2E family transporter [Fulvivirga sedimenti]|uniref:AI-2E family transporter n=1 Tax=Fulvivirga sedimenti TaxID=2879465 RepID=A0A9X1HRG8_9BACT|nr:AI-2E family transporter [Fulvivirga sedimenti]MCA6075434.1 AI-2E family transporter [Fulvivirga sedimenti]MCA6076611.1 AI-2E family transporter [Fulvivirga sedimenti]MCA6077739.1 AI-2E family transporter [Fulvivirga sedimenti]
MVNEFKSDRVVRATAWLLLIGLSLAMMILGQQLFIPLTWSLLFAFILFPFCDWMEGKKIGRTWSSLIATLLFTILSGVVLFYLVYQSVRILQQEGAVYDTISQAYENMRMWFYDKLGLEIFHPKEGAQFGSDSLGRVINFAAREISSIGKNIVTITLIPMFLFFLLLYRGLAWKFTRTRYEGKQLEQLETFYTKSQYSIQNYLWGTLILTGVTAAMAFVILLLFGIKYAFFFSIFIGILNLIPYIGNLAAFVVVLLFVYVTKHDIGLTIFCGLALYSANLMQENFLRPKLVGDKMKMNAMVVFTAVILGGMIWGFSGMVLFIPLLGVLKSLFESHPDLKVYGIFFETGDEPDSD